MRSRSASLAVAVTIVGLGLLAQPRGQPHHREEIVVVPGLSRMPGLLVARMAEPTVAPMPVADIAVGPAPEPASVEANYPYWEAEDAGIWATPAEFAEPE